jgi:LAO/AO transport system kinase
VSIRNKSPQDLLPLVLQGNVRAGARLMRLLDDRTQKSTDILQDLYPQTGRARVIGFTGNPGSGKSTLVNQMIGYYREQDLKVGVVCVDPSSPFSGGAILGDRIRMNAHATDPGVFIRSMATRGTLGGLSRSTYDVVHVMDAMGYDIILVETVGVGQDELDVMKLAESCVVILVPGMGDDIQAIKAGILEVADLFVVNKADNPEVHRTIKDLRYLQSLLPQAGEWETPILSTIATQGEGIAELAHELAAHYEALKSSEKGLNYRKRQRNIHVLMTILRAQLAERVEEEVALAGDALIDALVSRKTDPYRAANQILKQIIK